MNLKKGIISISTIVVVILGVFFAVRYIGGRENVSDNKLPSDSIAQNNNTILDNSNETSTNENSQAKSTNEMDATYINDKTNVGIYTVKVDDTVFSIVKTHMPSHDEGQVVEFIKNRNNMNSSYKIAVGQKIVIPYETSIKTSTTVATVTSVSANNYSIKKQDTLYSIAKSKMPSYNVKQAIKMLKETNKITNENAIKDGTLINIPK